MQAYLNDPQLKRRLIAEIRKHEKADQIVSGTYGELRDRKWVGCAIGCALHSLNKIEKVADPRLHTGEHARFPTELGIPIELAYHIDHVFENLPAAERKTWPRLVATAITPGADLSGVIPALLQWMILDKAAGLLSLVAAEDERATFREFAALVARDWAGDTITDQQWNEIDARLNKIPVWAWARAGAGAWARARAWAWAPEYSLLSGQTLKLLKEAR